MKLKGYLICKVKDDMDYRSEEIKKTDMLKWEHYDIFCVPVD